MASTVYLLGIIVSVLLTKEVSSLFPSDDNSVDHDERYLKGQQQYEMMKKWSDSAMPKYSQCWLNAMANLNSGCKRLTDDMQHRMSLKFTNCFLIKTGRESYECHDDDPIDLCTKDMTSHAYSTYIEFFTHTQNICFFLQAQAWQEETHYTIDRLADNSAHVAQQIEDSSELQSQVIQKQNESIKNQEMLLERGIELKHTLEESTVDVHHMLQEFKDSTKEQRALLFEVFDRLNALQSVVMGEFTGFYSLIFYAVSVLVSYILTSTPRTSTARFWLFVLMTANIAAERTIVVWGTEPTEDTTTGTAMDENTAVYFRLWWCRRVFCTLAVLLWARCAYTFKDMNRVNNKLLEEIRKQNSELKHMLQTGTPQKTNAVDTVDHASSTDLHNTALDVSKLNMITSWAESVKGHDVSRSIQFNKRDSTSTGYHSDSESDAQSTASYDSLMTDRTFTVTEVGEMSGSDTDTESCITAASWASSLYEELADLRQATPVREMAAFFDLNTGTTQSGELTNSGSKKRGRPKGSKNKSVTPQAVTVSSPSQYNLRSKRGVSRPVSNPVVESESADDFGKMVHHLSQVAKRNKVKAEITVGRGLDRNIKLSSDED